jgi:hypothetical protein
MHTSNVENSTPSSIYIFTQKPASAKLKKNYIKITQNQSAIATGRVSTGRIKSGVGVGVRGQLFWNTQKNKSFW